MIINYITLAFTSSSFSSSAASSHDSTKTSAISFSEGPRALGGCSVPATPSQLSAAYTSPSPRANLQSNA